MPLKRPDKRQLSQQFPLLHRENKAKKSRLAGGKTSFIHSPFDVGFCVRVCMCVCRAALVLREHWLSLCVKGGIRSPLAPGETLLRRPNPPKQAEKLVNTAAVADTQTLAISERLLSFSLSVPGLVAVIRALWKPL